MCCFTLWTVNTPNTWPDHTVCQSSTAKLSNDDCGLPKFAKKRSFSVEKSVKAFPPEPLIWLDRENKCQRFWQRVFTQAYYLSRKKNNWLLYDVSGSLWEVHTCGFGKLKTNGKKWKKAREQRGKKETKEWVSTHHTLLIICYGPKHTGKIIEEDPDYFCNTK